VQTIGLDLKQPIPGDLHLTTRNLPGIPNEPNSRWPESGVARYVAVSCPHPASIGSHTQPPNHHPKASDSRLSIASLPAQGVCAFLSITLPAVDTCSSQSVTGFTSPSSLLSSCHPSGAGAFLHTPAVIRAPPPTFPPNFPDWQRHLQKNFHRFAPSDWTRTRHPPPNSSCLADSALSTSSSATQPRTPAYHPSDRNSDYASLQGIHANSIQFNIHLKLHITSTATPSPPCLTHPTSSPRTRLPWTTSSSSPCHMT
jgi:hypothetical protein